MPEESKERPTLWDRLSMEREGVVFADGMRIVFLPASTLTDIERAGEKVVGRGLGAILYDAGERTGNGVGMYVRSVMGATSMDEVLQTVEQGHRDRGYGRVEFVSHDLMKGELVVRVYDSPYAETPEEGQGSACYFPAGFWAGLVHTATGRAVAAKETNCTSKGASFCEFAVRPNEGGD